VDTDGRHAFNISGSFTFPNGIRFSPVYYWRSALPVALVDGRDLNLDGDATEIPQARIAYAVDSFDLSKPQFSQTTFKEIGTCATVNCARGMPQQQMNFRSRRSSTWAAARGRSHRRDVQRVQLP
jgi:hypothetical protein